MLDVGIGIGKIIIPTVKIIFVSPIKIVWGFFFHSVLVNVYRFYFSLKKGILEQHPAYITKKWVSLINSRYSIHIAIAIIAFVTLMTSVSATQAENYVEKTMISSLLTPEFSDDVLIIETADESEGSADINKPVLYTRAGYINKTPTSLHALSEEEILQESVGSSISQGGSVLVKHNVATTDIDRRERNNSEIYTVKPGDTITSISRNFDISVNTILWENNLTAYSIIRPGKELIILPSTGLTHSVKKNETIIKLGETYQVEAEAILEANKLLADSTLRAGQKIFIPNGLKPQPTPAVRYVQPRKDNFARSPQGGKYIWPAQSYAISQYFTYRHFGLDIGARAGSPVFAAAEGEVTISSQGRWNGGYGNQVVIDHGNGVTTRYAHNSYNLVSVGEKVTQGQPIAAIGSTGRSSGPHSHFEITINGRRVNPLNYLSR